MSIDYVGCIVLFNWATYEFYICNETESQLKDLLEKVHASGF